ncbi:MULTISPECIES: McrB family protein [Acinetobacter]|uniref:McrB family protein n=1 Tax=Acinetobacter TaxID=469 RepID=UPI001D1802A8|nr:MULTISPECIES: AAA family ATPase [Acinetobacter]
MNQVNLTKPKWVRLYTEKLFPKIKEYENKQSELAIRIRDIKKSVGQDFKSDLIFDENKSIVNDEKYHHKEIDPFTVLSLLNVGTHANRLQMHNAFLELSEEEGFGLEDIKNIPSSDGQRAWYYPYKVFKNKNGSIVERDHDTIPKLWGVFKEINAKDNQEYLNFDDVKEILKISSVGINKLSTALYRCKPEVYFPLNAVGQRHLTKNEIKFNVNSGNTEKVNKKVWGDYIETLKALKKRKQESRNILDSYSRIVEQDKLNDVLFTRNQILYGPAGTGKTYNTINEALSIVYKIQKDTLKEIIQKELESRKIPISNEKIREEMNQRFNEYLKSTDKQIAQIGFVTFHQSYGYEDFVEGIKVKEVNGQLKYPVEAGVFKRFCKSAKDNPTENYVLIIDEINRGNISKIFGELITLIEESKRADQLEELSVTLPYSNEQFSVPNNLYIIGTMNSSDRSLTSVDIALRRRFEFIEMMPEPNVLKDIQITDYKDINVKAILETMNKRIQVLLDRDHCIGHAYFISLKNDASLEKLMKIFEKKIIPLLQEYFFDDWGKINLVLNKNGMVKMEKVEEYLFPNMQPHEREHLASRNWDINTELFEGDVDKKKEALMKIIEGKNKESIMEKVAS